MDKLVSLVLNAKTAEEEHYEKWKILDARISVLMGKLKNHMDKLADQVALDEQR